MKFLKIFNQLIIYFFYFLLVSIFFFTIYIVNTSDPFTKSFRKEFKTVVKKGNVKANFFNNYRVEHLPNTQFTK